MNNLSRLWLLLVVLILCALSAFAPYAPQDQFALAARRTATPERKGPRPHVTVLPVNCEPWSLCGQLPQLGFIAVDPSEEHTITALYVRIGGYEQECPPTACTLIMPETDAIGLIVEYWAESSFGDQSPVYRFRLRNQPRLTGYQFELLGKPWAEYAPPCALTWDLFPLVDESLWITSLSSPAQLQTDHQYALLAGRLIWHGQVDASSCDDGGLLENGAASQCGIEAAAAELDIWQNQHDPAIYQAAIAKNIPPMILKSVIAQESQFWPNDGNKDEFGLGHITEQGVDLLLTWNVDYYLASCVPVFGKNRCASGYSNLSDYQQAYLRGMALQAIGTDGEIELLADTLQAACAQTGQLVRNISDYSLPEVAHYEELWPLTLAVYHAGPGCVGTALEASWEQSGSIAWEQVAEQLVGDCQQARQYVHNVVFYSQPTDVARQE